MRLIDADALKRKAQNVATEAWKMKLTARIEQVINQFIDWIDDAPTVPQWIPVSERLPKKEGYFFVTDEAAGMAETLIDKYLRCDDGEWVWLYSQNVVAWMPLPAPFKED